MELGVHGDWSDRSKLTITGPTFLGLVSARDFPAKLAKAVSAAPADQVPLITFKPRPADVAAGAWDKALDEARRSASQMVYVYPWHEPEDDMTGPTFVKMFNRVYSRLASPDLLVGYCAMAYQWRSGNKTTRYPSQWRPTAYDWLGCDVYSGNSVPTSTPLSTHPGFQRWWKELAGRGRFMLPERGWKGDDVVRAKTIAADAEWLRASPCDMLNAWNTTGTENDAGWVLTGAARQALSSGLKLLGGGA